MLDTAGNLLSFRLIYDFVVDLGSQDIYDQIHGCKHTAAQQQAA